MVLELFLIAEIPSEDLQRARDILGGYCAQSGGSEFIYHVHEYVGPRKPTGMTHPAAQQTGTPLQKDAPQLWQQFDAALRRKTSYHISARYEVRREDFDAGSAAPDPNATPGIVRWMDFPDPPVAVGVEERGLVTQRKVIEIWEQKQLPVVLTRNNYRLKFDRFEHNILFRTRQDVEFKLYRTLYPREHKYYQTEEPTPGLEPVARLPPWEALNPLFPDDRWLLHVSVFLQDSSGPDDLVKAQERLVGIKREFDGVFRFLVIDRKVFDTRVPEERVTMPAPLPQVIKATD